MFKRLLAPRLVVRAHCDVPCGIYDPSTAKIAADTVAKMVEKIVGFEKEITAAAGGSQVNARNNLVRSIQVKEEHAERVKHEILILWGDYFKPEHLAKHPTLHDTVWKAVKLASKNKQNVDAAAATELQAAVKTISDIFWDTKKA